MKNKFKLSLILFFLISNVNAQQYVDLKFRLTAPSGHTSQPSMKSFSVKGFLSNVGEDTLTTRDSLAIYLLVGSDSFTFFNNGRMENFKTLAGMKLNPGDSQLVLLPMAFDKSFEGMDFDLCLLVKPLNRSTNLIKDTLLFNNKGCATIHVTASTAIKDIYVSGPGTLYPNPAKDYFSCNKGEILGIQDVTGKYIHTEKKDNSVDCRLLPAGIYFVRINTLGVLSTERLIINN